MQTTFIEFNKAGGENQTILSSFEETLQTR